MKKQLRTEVRQTEVRQTEVRLTEVRRTFSPHILFGFAALLAAAIFIIGGCETGDDGGETVTYSGTTGGKTYTLVITSSEGRAAYTPKSGDRYELTINPGNSRSVGTVTVSVGTTLTLKPSNASATFTVTVTVSGEGGGSIGAITGTITIEGGGTLAGPGTISSGGSSSGGGGGGGGNNTFVAVTDITGAPATMAVELPLILSGTVAPANATNKTIVWNVKDAGTTGAVITGSSLSATALGDAGLTATLANGGAAGTPFTKDFTVTVGPFVFVTYISGGWILDAEIGEPLALNNLHWVRPNNATDKTITWSVKTPGSTGAVITGNSLTATALGDATLTGTVANGLGVGIPYTEDRTVTVKGPLETKDDFVVREILGGVELAQYLGNATAVLIPGDLGITVIGPASFQLSTITSVVVPDGVTKIDRVAFLESYSLASVTLPESLQTIRDEAFNACPVLYSMTVKATTPPSVTDKMFGSNSPKTLTAIYVPVGSVDAYKSAEGWKKHADLITAITP